MTTRDDVRAMLTPQTEEERGLMQWMAWAYRLGCETPPRPPEDQLPEDFKQWCAERREAA